MSLRDGGSTAAMTSESEREQRQGTDGTVGVGREPAVVSAPGRSIYDDVLALLMARGWIRGSSQRGVRVSLPAAIDLAARADAAHRTPPGGAVLARAARARRHLCELARVSSLTAWNDDRARSLADVFDLLHEASVAFPDD